MTTQADSCGYSKIGCYDFNNEADHVKNNTVNLVTIPILPFPQICNLVFVTYFCIEQVLKMWALGWKRFSWDRGNLFDAVITILLLVSKMC